MEQEFTVSEAEWWSAKQLEVESSQETYRKEASKYLVCWFALEA